MSPSSAKIHQDVDQIRQGIDQQGLTFAVAPNAAMHYSLSQLCGRKPSLPVHPEFRQHEPGGMHNDLPQPLATALPTSYLGWSSSVKNQGSCGDCWALGTIGALEGTYLKTHGSPAITVSGASPNLSEQQVTSCKPWAGAATAATWPSRCSSSPRRDPATNLARLPRPTSPSWPWMRRATSVPTRPTRR